MTDTHPSIQQCEIISRNVFIPLDVQKLGMTNWEIKQIFTFCIIILHSMSIADTIICPVYSKSSAHCKRARIRVPLWKKTHVEDLPDECLMEIFKRINGDRDRVSCASVSKRWLMLLGTTPSGIDDIGGVLRCLERDGVTVTDVGLLAISAGVGRRLSEFFMRGCYSVTTLGLSAIAGCCPSLRIISLCNLPSLSDDGVIKIANGCPRLEKVVFQSCSISDKSLLGIAVNCPNLEELKLEKCLNVGDDGLVGIGRCCLKLRSISIKGCLGIGDRGVSSLVSSSSFTLEKLKLHKVGVTDVSLAIIGHYGKSVMKLSLVDLDNVTEKGFWVMGNCDGLQKLRVLEVDSCNGLTDLGLETVGRGCPNLKRVCLWKCPVSCKGLASLCRVSLALEMIRPDEHSSANVLVFLVNLGLSSLPRKTKELGLFMHL